MLRNLDEVERDDPFREEILPCDGMRRKILPLFDMKALDGDPPPPREWILDDYIPANEITLFTGPGGAGKSLLSQQMATCLALGAPFLGMPTRPTHTLFVTAEDGTDELHRRQRNIVAVTGPGELDGKLHLASLRGSLTNELARFDRDGALERTNTFSILKDTIAQTGATFLVLDNLAHLFGGNENDRGQVTAFINALYSLRRDIRLDYGEGRDLTILLIGHPNKSGDAYSGSTAWLNAVRSQIELARIQDDDGNVHDPDARILKLGKANYARAGTETRFRWHNFAFVADDDLPRDIRYELADCAKANSENSAFLDCLRARAAQGDGRAVGPAPGPNYAPAQFEGMREAKGYRKPALKLAMDRLFAIGEIESVLVENKKAKRSGYVIREVENGLHNSPHMSRTSLPHIPAHPPAQHTAEHTVGTTYLMGAAPEGPPRPELNKPTRERNLP